MLNANDFKKKQIVFLFTNEGDKLSFLNDNIIVKNKEGGIKYQSTCYRLFMHSFRNFNYTYLAQLKLVISQ